jgi:beta-mannosidase
LIVVGHWERATSVAGRFEDVPGAGDLAWESVEPPVRGSDDADHWFRTQIDAPDPAPVLVLGGLASVCDVFVDGELIGRSESMFVEREIPVAAGAHEIVICARALSPLLAQRRRPRARWRTRVTSDGNLRWIRTSLFGRAPGFSPGPPIVGPWRPLEIRQQDGASISVRARLQGRDGVVEVRAPESLGELELELDARTTAMGAGGGSLSIPAPALWWPHTHGAPELHTLKVRTEHRETVHKLGFRRLAVADAATRNGLDIHINDIPIFVRGAIWSRPPHASVGPMLERVRDAGLNMVRVVGTTFYEGAEFHDLCDALGILVWQDMMFANMDYPFEDREFLTLAEAEVRQAVREVAGRPSLAVVCGNSEIEQQVSMLGLPPDLGKAEFFSTTVPRLLDEAGIDAAYVPSAPSGGDFPFRTAQGVAHYFGVGAYRRDVTDARRAEVRFAAECLAFANVPDDDPADTSAGVMRDAGADWDFADVRDHYLRVREDVGREDPDYWERARFVTGELMAEVFGEWRRADSPTKGALILWLRDLVPGSGWGILDSEGKPKVAWYQLRRALAPFAVWLVDEGLDGLAIHAANDSGKTVAATLRLAVYRDESIPVATVETPVELQPHTAIELDAEGLLGRFVDINYAYRFGAAQQDVVVVTLAAPDRTISQAFRYPVGLSRARRPQTELGLVTAARRAEDGDVDLSITAERLVRGLRIEARGFELEDNGFDLEPGGERTVRLRRAPHDDAGAIIVRALNLDGQLEVSPRD